MATTVISQLNAYSVEIKERGTTIKFISTLATNALSALDKIASLYPVGPYQFIARLVKEAG